MDDSTHILEYIDGTLDASQEQSLFEEMARHPEMRTALRQHLQISAAVRGDGATFGPPAHVEQALMATIGLAPRRRRFAGWIPAGSRLLPLGLAFLLGGLLGAGVLYLWAPGRAEKSLASSTPDATLRSSTSDRSSGPGTKGPWSTPPGDAIASNAKRAGEHAAGSSGTRGMAAGVTSSRPGAFTDGSTAPSASASMATASAAPNALRAGGMAAALSTSRSVSTRSAAPRRPRATRASSSRLATERGEERVVPASDPVALTTSARELGGVSGGANGTGLPLVRPTAVRAIPPQRPVPAHTEELPNRPFHRDPRSVSTPLEEGTREGEISLHAARSFGGDLASIDARSDGRSGLDDWTLGIRYQLERDVSIGAFVGLQPFAQLLRYDTGDTLLVEQRPRYFWAGVGGRYQPLGLGSSTVTPFVEGVLGLCAAGPIARGSVGLELRPVSLMALSLGVDLTALTYSSSGEAQVSGRWGLGGGLSLYFP